MLKAKTKQTNHQKPQEKQLAKKVFLHAVNIIKQAFITKEQKAG